MEASKAREAYLQPSKLTVGEYAGMAAALVLVGSLFLPWFGTSDNPNSEIESAGVGPGDTATAWETFPTLRYLLLAAAIAPFLLSWIVARSHKLTWAPGEVTMIVGITSFVLIICNGIILGKPEPGIEVSLEIGYLVGLIASLGMAVSGFLRQALQTGGRKPPGSL